MGKKEIERERKRRERQLAKQQSKESLNSNAEFIEDAPPSPPPEPDPYIDIMGFPCHRNRLNLISWMGNLVIVPQLISTLLLYTLHFGFNHAFGHDYKFREQLNRAAYFAVQVHTNEHLTSMLFISCFLHLCAFFRVGGHTSRRRDLKKEIGPQFTVVIDVCMLLMLFFPLPIVSVGHPEYMQQWAIGFGLWIFLTAGSYFDIVMNHEPPFERLDEFREARSQIQDPYRNGIDLPVDYPIFCVMLGVARFAVAMASIHEGVPSASALGCWMYPMTSFVFDVADIWDFLQNVPPSPAPEPFALFARLARHRALVGMTLTMIMSLIGGQPWYVPGHMEGHTFYALIVFFGITLLFHGRSALLAVAVGVFGFISVRFDLLWRAWDGSDTLALYWPEVYLVEE